MMNKWVQWQEPDELDGDVTMHITVAEAITRMKENAAKKGFIYNSDEQALDDFLTIHWAWIAE